MSRSLEFFSFLSDWLYLQSQLPRHFFLLALNFLPFPQAQITPVWLPCCDSWPSITPKTPTISSWSDWLRWVATQTALCARSQWTFGEGRVERTRAAVDSLLFVPPQGLTHLGKGTLTLCPYHSDRQLMSQVAVAGLLTVLVSFLDVKNSEFVFLPAAVTSCRLVQLVFLIVQSALRRVWSWFSALQRKVDFIDSTSGRLCHHDQILKLCPARSSSHWRLLRVLQSSWESRTTFSTGWLRRCSRVCWSLSTRSYDRCPCPSEWDRWWLENQFLWKTVIVIVKTVNRIVCL